MTKPTPSQRRVTCFLAITQLAIGIVVCVLASAVMMRAKVVSENTLIYVNGQLQEIFITDHGFVAGLEAGWLLGLPFLVPGVFGLITVCVRHEAMYGIYMALNIIILVIYSVFVLLGFVFLTFMSGTVNGNVPCRSVASACVCGTTGDKIPDKLLNAGADILNDMTDGVVGGKCDDVNLLISLLIAVVALIILGWVISLNGAINSCCACCCGTRPLPEGGYVVAGPAGPVVTIATMTTGAAVSPPYPAQGQFDGEQTGFKYARIA